LKIGRHLVKLWTRVECRVIAQVGHNEFNLDRQTVRIGSDCNLIELNDFA